MGKLQSECEAVPSPAERIRIKKEQRKEKRKQQKKEWRERRKNNVKTESHTSDEALPQSAADRKRRERFRKKQILEEQRIRMMKNNEKQKRWRLKRRESITGMSNIVESPKSCVVTKAAFQNKMQKCRALKKLKDSLPLSPSRRASTIKAYLQNTKSPAVQALQKENMVKSSTDDRERTLGLAVLKDINSSLSDTKHRRSDDARAALNFLSLSVCGESVKKSRSKNALAKTLGLPVKRLSKGFAIRTRVLHTHKSCFEYTKRKTRSDALSDETKSLAYNFWCLPENTHPTGNKKDVKRVRIGVKKYSSHAIYILEKTQTEVFNEFKIKNPDIKMSQRTFEKCKPYFVRSARPKDRVTCCCRYHLEMKYVFKPCMEYRKNHNSSISPLPVFESIYEICHETLCSPSSEGFHKNECHDRKCSACGVKKV